MIQHISSARNVCLYSTHLLRNMPFYWVRWSCHIIHVRILCHLLVASASLRPQTSRTPGPHLSHPWKLSWRGGKGNCWSIPIKSYKHKSTPLGLLFCSSWSLLQKFLMLYVKSNSAFLAPPAFILPHTWERNSRTSVYHEACVWLSLTCACLKEKEYPSLPLFFKNFVYKVF